MTFEILQEFCYCLFLWLKLYNFLLLKLFSKQSALRIPITILIRFLEITAHLCTVLKKCCTFENQCCLESLPFPIQSGSLTRILTKELLLSEFCLRKVGWLLLNLWNFATFYMSSFNFRICITSKIFPLLSIIYFDMQAILDPPWSSCWPCFPSKNSTGAKFRT